jgi:plasmid stabilization system protein ParE
MPSKPSRARPTASATSQLLKDIKDFQWIDGTKELLEQTAHKDSEIEFIARQRQSAALRAGVRYDFDELLRDVRNAALYARDKHPDDLPDIYRSLGSTDAVPRRRRFNANLEQDVERVAKELHLKLQRPGVRYDLAQISAFVRKTALDVLNTHPDDLHEDFRSLGNPNVSRNEPYPKYALAQRCARMEVRFAPHGTAFMPVRTLVIAEPEHGWSRVRVLAIPSIWPTARGGSVEMLTPMTAPSVKELLASAAAMNLNVSRRHYLLSPKKRVSR